MLLNAYCTHRALPALDFPHVLRSRRDRREPRLAEHLDGFMGFVMDGGKRPMTAVRYHVLQHLERVQWQVALEVEDAHRAAFAAWAQAANAIVFLPDATVRTPSGAVLVDPRTGDPEPGADAPHPADAATRKERTTARLQNLGVAVVASLPPVAGEAEVLLRDTSAITARCLALLACAVRAESLASGDALSAADVAGRLPGATFAMSPRERTFFEAEAPEPQEVTNHVWRYESLATLLWSVGALAELPMPTGLCDVPTIARLVLSEGGATFAAAASLRPASELLDALDLHYRLHWATTSARTKGAPPPAGLEPGVVFERHYALNWLTCFQDAEWDDVDTPT
jgi:hypothetical protein